MKYLKLLILFLSMNLGGHAMAADMWIDGHSSQTQITTNTIPGGGQAPVDLYPNIILGSNVTYLSPNSIKIGSLKIRIDITDSNKVKYLLNSHAQAVTFFPRTVTFEFTIDRSQLAINNTYSLPKVDPFLTLQYCTKKGNCDEKATVFKQYTVGLNAFNIEPEVKTCSLTSESTRTITLQTVQASTLRSNTEVRGGSFPIELSCLGATANKAYISYTDGTNPTNTTNTLSIDNSSTAKGVALRIYPTDSTTAITYGAQSNTSYINIADSNITLFSNSTAGKSVVAKNYNVYYVKTGAASDVKAGDITARLIYQMYYQ